MLVLHFCYVVDEIDMARRGGLIAGLFLSLWLMKAQATSCTDPPPKCAEGTSLASSSRLREFLAGTLNPDEDIPDNLTIAFFGDQGRNPVT